MTDSLPTSPVPPEGTNGNALAPLPGEHGIPDVAQRAKVSVSKKGLAAVAFLVLSLAVVSALSIHRLAMGSKPSDADAKAAGNRPSTANTEPRRLDLTAVRAASFQPAAASAVRIPAIVPGPEDAEPIGVRRTTQTAPSSASPSVASPEDAPVMVVSSRLNSTSARDNTGDAGAQGSLDQTKRNLEGYRQQLQGLVDNLSRTTAAASRGTTPSLGAQPGGSSTIAASAGSPVPASLFGGQLVGSATPRSTATMLGNRSLTLPKGTTFTCALKTKVVSATSGFVGCQVQRNVYSDDGRILLIERGSHLDGEYRAASIRPGTVRIPVLWTRIRTPNGVTVDIDSPGTGPLGESGIDGYVDNRWGERIAAALLLSLIDDSVKLVIQRESSSGAGGAILLPSTTDSTSKLAETVLDSTINIPPLIYQNQGGIVGIYVARDVDFSSVYELRPVAR